MKAFKTWEERDTHLQDLANVINKMMEGVFSGELKVDDRLIGWNASLDWYKKRLSLLITYKGLWTVIDEIIYDLPYKLRDDSSKHHSHFIPFIIKYSGERMDDIPMEGQDITSTSAVESTVLSFLLEDKPNIDPQQLAQIRRKLTNCLYDYKELGKITNKLLEELGTPPSLQDSDMFELLTSIFENHYRDLIEIIYPREIFVELPSFINSALGNQLMEAIKDIVNNPSRYRLSPEVSEELKRLLRIYGMEGLVSGILKMSVLHRNLFPLWKKVELPDLSYILTRFTDFSRRCEILNQ